MSFLWYQKSRNFIYYEWTILLLFSYLGHKHCFFLIIPSKKITFITGILVYLEEKNLGILWVLLENSKYFSISLFYSFSRQKRDFGSSQDHPILNSVEVFLISTVKFKIIHLSQKINFKISKCFTRFNYLEFLFQDLEAFPRD